MKINLYQKKILPMACAALLLSACSKEEAAAPAVVLPNVSSSNTTTPTFTVPDSTPAVTPEITPDISSTEVEEDAVSAATEVVEQNEGETRIAFLTDQSSMGAARMLRDNEIGTTANPYTVHLVNSDQEIVDLLEQGSVDLALMDSAAAAEYYSRSQDVTALFVSTMGDLQLVSKSDSVSGLSDVEGKTLWLSGEGTSEEILVRKAFRDAGVEVNYEFLTDVEIMERLNSSDDGVAVLPVARAAEMTGINIVSTFGPNSPMNCMVVRNGFLEEYANQVNDFLVDYQISLTYMQRTDGEQAQLLTDAGLVSQEAAKLDTLVSANLCYLVGDSMKSSLESYYLTLFAEDPTVLGGAMPYDDFYFGAP